ncbi:MAG TPA: hypothetical protein VGL06_15295 [Pseudonocardiaceae bacterium]
MTERWSIAGVDPIVGMALDQALLARGGHIDSDSNDDRGRAR